MGLVDFAGRIWNYNARGGGGRLEVRSTLFPVSRQLVYKLFADLLSILFSIIGCQRLSIVVEASKFSTRCSEGAVGKGWWCLPSSVIYVPSCLPPRCPQRLKSGTSAFVVSPCDRRQVVASWRCPVLSLFRVLSVGGLFDALVEVRRLRRSLDERIPSRNRCVVFVLQSFSFISFVRAYYPYDCNFRSFSVELGVFGTTFQGACSAVICLTCLISLIKTHHSPAGHRTPSQFMG